MDFEFSQHIGFYIQEVARKTLVSLNKALEPFDITYAQCRVLNCLWKRGALTQKEILAIISVQPSTLTGVIDLLVEKNLVTRLEDGIDGRLRRVALTEKGAELRQPVWEAIDQIEQETTKHMSPELRLTILEALKEIGKALEVMEVKMF